MQTYEAVIVQAFAVFPLVALLITVPYLIYCYRTYGSAWGLRALIVYSFVLYLMCVYFLVILPLPTVSEVKAMTSPFVQLVPFAFVADMVKESHVVATDPASYMTLINNKAFYPALFNVIMTVPFGMYLRYFFKCSLGKTVLLSFALSLFFELTQLSGLYGIYPRPYRIFDVDDLIQNTAGGAVGYGVMGPLMRILPTREELDRASLRRGRDVSLTRRVLALAVDGVVMGEVYLVLHWFLLAVLHEGVPSWMFGAVAMAYFVMVPLLLRRRTIGCALLKLKVVAQEGEIARPWQLVVRFGCLAGALVLLPSLIFCWPDVRGGLGVLSGGAGGLPRALAFVAYAGLVAGLLVRAARGRRLFYERWSQTKLSSTVIAEGS